MTNNTVPNNPAVAYELMSVMPPSCCQMVSARMAMAATAARNKALRGGNKNASAPTGTRNKTPKPLATPPQVCNSNINDSMSTAA